MSETSFETAGVIAFLKSRNVDVRMAPPQYIFRQKKSIISLRNYFIILVGVILVLFNLVEHPGLSMLGLVIALFPMIEYFFLRPTPRIVIDTEKDEIYKNGYYRWHSPLIARFEQVQTLHVHQHARYGDANPFTDSTTENIYEFTAGLEGSKKEWKLFSLTIRDNRNEAKIKEVLNWLKYLLNQ